MSAVWPSQVSFESASPEIVQSFEQLLQEEKIPVTASMRQQLEQLYWPMAQWISARQHDKTLVIGINGAQGSGKSTLAKMLERLLTEGLHKHVVSFSIDDIYLTRQQRIELAEAVHPLLKTRGVPGTHDTRLGMDIIHACGSGDSTQCQIPVFDKARDDRADPSRWKNVNTPVDIVLFEGWCVGSIAESEATLKAPVNQLEQEEDTDVRWRDYVNQQLAGPYKELYAMLDYLFLLKVPSMDKVYEWRLLQENKLRQLHAANPDADNNIMSEQEIRRFIMHYERITRSNLDDLPQFADVVMTINNEHQIDAVELKA